MSATDAVFGIGGNRRLCHTVFGGAVTACPSPTDTSTFVQPPPQGGVIVMIRVLTVGVRPTTAVPGRPLRASRTVKINCVRCGTASARFARLAARRLTARLRSASVLVPPLPLTTTLRHCGCNATLSPLRPRSALGRPTGGLPRLSRRYSLRSLRCSLVPPLSW